MRTETAIEIECVCGKHTEIPLSKVQSLKSCDRCGLRIEIDMAPWNRPERKDGALKVERHSVQAAAA